MNDVGEIDPRVNRADGITAVRYWLHTGLQPLANRFARYAANILDLVEGSSPAGHHTYNDK
jgi:hypothetical protein